MRNPRAIPLPGIILAGLFMAGCQHSRCGSGNGMCGTPPPPPAPAAPAPRSGSSNPANPLGMANPGAIGSQPVFTNPAVVPVGNVAPATPATPRAATPPASPGFDPTPSAPPAAPTTPAAGTVPTMPPPSSRYPGD